MVGDKFMKSGRLINFYKLPINKRKNFAKGSTYKI